MASNIHSLGDLNELVELCKPLGLYLKPIARLNISVQLPQLKEPGKSISNWDLMEKLKKLIRPHQFQSIKVAKSSLEFVRFEAEVDSWSILQSVVSLLDNSSMKIIGFFETLKVKAAEAKVPFPARHDWDSFFRDAKNMDEMKAGERPDTIYLANLPYKWFIDERKLKDAGKVEPSESVLRKVFEAFGDVRCVDIPMIDPYRTEMTPKASGIRTFGTFGAQDLTFEAYVQYVEYISFVKAMDALRGMKFCYIDTEGKALGATVKVDFDRTKHLSDKYIKRRRIEREKLMQLQQERDAKNKREREELEKRVNEEREKEEAERTRIEQEQEERRRQREEKRRLRALEKRRREDHEYMDMKIRMEERKFLITQRRLQSIRMLGELLKRVQVVKQREEVELKLRELEEAKLREMEEKARLEEEERFRRDRLLKNREEKLRKQVVRNWHSVDDRKKEIQRETRLLHLADRPENLRSFTVATNNSSDAATAVSPERGRGKSRQIRDLSSDRRDKRSSPQEKLKSSVERRSSNSHSRSRSAAKRSPTDNQCWSHSNLTVTTYISTNRSIKKRSRSPEVTLYD